jgi:hypothetical protein
MKPIIAPKIVENLPLLGSKLRLRSKKKKILLNQSIRKRLDVFDVKSLDIIHKNVQIIELWLYEMMVS